MQRFHFISITSRCKISIHEQMLWLLTVHGASNITWRTPGLSVWPMIQKNTETLIRHFCRQVRFDSFIVFVCSVSHWSDLSRSLGDSMSTFTHLLESDGRWYRPWTGTTTSCFPERKTSAVKPDDKYSGASRSTFESRRTYNTLKQHKQTPHMLHFNMNLYKININGANLQTRVTS